MAASPHNSDAKAEHVEELHGLAAPVHWLHGQPLNNHKGC
jgi:hypothetical protein